jgi:transcriptional regulator with XRE-family HTH domain
MLGDKIKKMRKEHKVTQTQLAEAVGLRQSAIGMIERNKNGASPDKLKEIANFFGVTVDYLLSDEEIVIKSNNNVSKLTTKEKLDIEKEAQKMIDNIDKLDTVEFCGTPADEEDKEYLKLAYEKFLTDVRIYNKQKYTPKKYRDK